MRRNLGCVFGFPRCGILRRKGAAMGYKLTSLLRLPRMGGVELYVFVVGAWIWEGGLDEVVRKNFDNLAREFGPNAIIVDALTEEFHGEVVQKYLGKNCDELQSMLPAILLTDSHPDELTEESMRVLVPLGDVRRHYEIVDDFLADLASFARGESNQLLQYLEQASRSARAREAATDIIRVNIPIVPGVVAINLNHACRHLSAWYAQHKSRST